MPSRREFVRTAGAGLGAAALGRLPESHPHEAPAILRGGTEPAVISSANGLSAIPHALDRITAGGDTLQAVVEAVNLVEQDPEDMSVGYGGLPNEEGVVQLDACVMHGPSRSAGAVAAIEGVKTPSRVAVAVMRHTDHVMLVGQGATDFARRMGFEVLDSLLTPASRQRWLEWLTTRSGQDDWIAPEASGLGDSDFLRQLTRPYTGHDTTGAGMRDSHDGVRPHGTINCLAVDRNGNLSGVTTTSGMAWKIPGRVGDSPIIGAGLYVDNDVGAAGSTGRGEAVIKTVGSHTVVEQLRQGRKPVDAAVEALHRIVRWTEAQPRLQRPDGRPAFNVSYYVLNRNGELGAASLWPTRYAVAVGDRAELRDGAHLFDD